MAQKTQKYLDENGEETDYLDDDGNPMPAFDSPQGPPWDPPVVKAEEKKLLPSGMTQLQKMKAGLVPGNPKQGDIGRQDQSAVGIDHEMLANMITDKTAPIDEKINKYIPRELEFGIHNPLTHAGVFTGDVLASVIEGLTDPEGLALGVIGKASSGLKAISKANVLERLKNLTYGPAENLAKISSGVDSSLATNLSKLPTINPNTSMKDAIGPTAKANRPIVIENGVAKIAKLPTPEELKAKFESAGKTEVIPDELDDVATKLQEIRDKARGKKINSRSETVTLESPTADDIKLLNDQGYTVTESNSKSMMFKKSTVKDAAPNQRAKIQRGANDPVDVIFNSPEDREIFGAGQSLSNKDGIKPGVLDRFRIASEKVAAEHGLNPQEAREAVHSYNEAVRELAKNQPKTFENGTGRVTAPSFLDHVTRIVKNEKGAIGDQSGPKNLRELQAFHGTPNRELNLEDLDLNREPIRGRSGPPGIYFSNAEGANSYARNPIGAKDRAFGKILEATLTFENPLDITKDIAKYRKKGLSFTDAKREALKSLNSTHDGVIFNGDKLNPPEYIALRKETIKPPSRLGKLLEDETGALNLRGWGRSSAENVRSKILNELVESNFEDDPKAILAVMAKRREKTLSAGQFRKIVDDILTSGDYEQAVNKKIGASSSLLFDSSIASPEAQSAISSIIDNVKANIISRNEQDALVRAERARRFENIKKIQSTGAQTKFDTLKELKGQYPKITPPDISQAVSPEIVDQLHQEIFTHPKLDVPARFRTQIALDKVLGRGEQHGALQSNEIKLLQDFFGKESTDELLQMYSGMGFNLPGNFGESLTQLGEIAKTTRSAGDIGWPFRQGLNYAGRKSWRDALVPSLRSYFSRGSAEEALGKIKNDIDFALAKKSGLDMSDFDSANPAHREESNPSAFFENIEKKGLLQKIAVTPVTGSSRAMNVGTALMRFGEFKAKIKAYDALYQAELRDAIAKRDPYRIKNAEMLNPRQDWNSKRLAYEINRDTGRGEMPAILKGSERVLNATMFSPRLLASRLRSAGNILHMLNEQLKVAVGNPEMALKSDPIQRRDALKQLLSIGTVIGDTMAAGYAMGGKSSGNATSSNFLKSQLDRIRMEGGGGYIPLAIAGARIATGATTTTKGDINHLGDYGSSSGVQIAEDVLFNNRASPVGQLTQAIINGEEFGGKPLNFTSPNPFENTAIKNILVPILTEDLYEIAKTDPDLLHGFLTKSVPTLVPNALGIGFQAMQDGKRPKKPAMKLRSFGPLSYPSDARKLTDVQVNKKQ